MATTITPTTIATICAEYNVTPEQFSKATRIIDCNRNKVFYQVDSQTDPTIDPYHVEFNTRFGKLTCTCPAGQQAISCWHMRAALASEKYYKATEQARRSNEQATVEATQAYVYEQAVATLTWAMANLDRLEHEAMTVQELYQEDDRILAEYEQIEDACERARRRADFQLAAKYQAMLDTLEPRVEEAMHRQASIA